MSKRITINLFDSKSISNAIKELQVYQQQLRTGVSELIETLTNEGVSIAKTFISSSNIDNILVNNIKGYTSGEMSNSIMGYFNPAANIGIIKADAWYAVWVEYGFGIVGQNKPHPDSADIGWDYDINNHGDEGWYYYDPSANVKWKWSKGIPSTPYMWETLLYLTDNVKNISKKLFV